MTAHVYSISRYRNIYRFSSSNSTGAGFTTSGLCYYVHKKKRHTAEKGLSTTANPAYATELITVASSTHGDFKTEAKPCLC